MNGNLFEMLGIPDPEAQPSVPPMPAAIQSTVLVCPRSGKCSCCQQPRLGLHAFLAQRYPLRPRQQLVGAATPLQIDDRKTTDRSNAFCDITLTVHAGDDRFVLELLHPPWDDQVRQLISTYGGQWIDSVEQIKMVIDVPVKKHRFIRQLAQAVRRVISPRHVRRTGKRYPISDWRWVAERTAGSLDGLASAVWEYRKYRARHRFPVGKLKRHAQTVPVQNKRQLPENPASIGSRGVESCGRALGQIALALPALSSLN